MTFEEIATGFGECKFGEVSKFRALVRNAWDLLTSVLTRCEWSDLGISPSVVRDPGSTWHSFVASPQVRCWIPWLDSHVVNRHFPENRLAFESSVTCRWLHRVTSESRLQRLQRLARRFSDTSELSQIWFRRDNEDNYRREYDKHLDRLMLHKDDQGEADRIRDAIRSSSFGIAFNAASFACICKELQLLEDGVRDLLPDCLNLIPVVGEHRLCPSDAELRSMADRFRSLESRILTMLREDLPAPVSFDFRQGASVNWWGCFAKSWLDWKWSGPKVLRQDVS